MRPSKIVELPTRLLVQALGSEKRYKRVGIIGGVLLVALGIGAYVTVNALETRSAEAAAAELGALQSCLLGDPLAANEKPSTRLRYVQLAALSLPSDKRAKAGESPWPSNCSVYALSLSERFGGASSAGLGTNFMTLGKTIKEDAWGTKLPELVDSVLAEVAAKGVKPMAVTNVPVAPKALVPVFDTAKFAALPKALGGRFSLSAVKPGASSKGVLRFVLDAKDQDGTLLCTASGGSSPGVKCVPVPAPVAALAPGVGLGGTAETGMLPVLSAGLGDNAGVFMGENKVASGLLLGAHVRSGGTAAVLVRSGKDAKLVVVPATGAPQDRGVVDPAITSTAHVGLGHDQVVWFAGKPGPMHLHARKLGPTGFAAAAVDIGEAPATPNTETPDSGIDFCNSGEATIVRGRAGQTDVIATLAGGRWSVPMKGGPAGGSLTCRSLEAVTTHVEHSITDDKNWATITYTKCNAGGCSATKVPLKELLAGMPEIVPVDTKAVVAADIGGKLAVVWNAPRPGGLRLKFGAPDQLKTAPDVVIYDGVEEGGAATLTSFVEMKLLPFDEDALLLLSTTTGVRAMRIDKAGVVTSMNMTK